MEKLFKSRLCTLVYEQDEWDTDLGVASQMVCKECIPDEGISLFEISATYAKQVPPAKYYYLSTSIKSAKERFFNVMGSWMKVVSIRLVPSEEAKHILTNLRSFNLIV